MNYSKKNKTSTATKAIKKENVSNNNASNFLLYGLLFGTFVLFYNTFNNEFTNWDDNDYITQNGLIQNGTLQGFFNLFTSVYSWNYHPITALSNWLEFKFFALNPKPYHFFNVLIHVLNVWLVYRFVMLLKNNSQLALLVSLLFAIHPMHVESVAWAAERKDLLYTFFALISLIYYCNYLNSTTTKNLILVFLFFVLSLLSKSAAVILPLLYLLLDYYKQRSFSIKTIVEKIPFFILSVIIGYVALQSQQGAIHDSPEYSIGDRFFLVNYSVVFYILKLVVPFSFSALRAYPTELSIYYYLAPIVVVALLIFCIKIKQFKREIIFGMLFYFVSILLVMQIIPVGKAIVAERYSYLSYIGLFFILINIYEEKITTPSFKKVAQPILIAFVLICIFQTFNRNKVWKSSITLWQDVVDNFPETSNAHLNLGNAKSLLGDDKAAIEAYNNGIKIDPNYTEFYVNRGNSKKNVGDITGAIADFSIVIEKWPTQKIGYFNRGATRNVNKEWSAAIQDLNKAIELDSTQFQFYVERGLAKDNLLDYDGAIKDYNKSLTLKNDFAITYTNRGIVFYKMNLLEKGCEDWKKAMSLGNAQAVDLIKSYCK